MSVGRFHRGLLLSLALIAACRAPDPFSDTGVSLAQNDGPILVILALDPAEPGANRARVRLREPLGNPVAARRVEVGEVALGADGDGFAGEVRLAQGRQRLEVRADLGPDGTRRVAFDLALPAERAADLIASVDAAMNGLRSAREMNDLGIGGPAVVTRAEFAAPDRVRFFVEAPSRPVTETIIVAGVRFDREGRGPWERQELGDPYAWPRYEYARGAARVRLVGRERVDGVEAFVVAFVDRGSEAHFRLWVGADDRLVRRYVMMARGHYMTGAFRDLDAPVVIRAP